MAKKSKQCGNSSGNPDRNWRDIMEEFDRKQRRRDCVFKKHNLIMPERGVPSLSDDENDILRLVLRGTTLAEIAEMFAVSPELIEECVNKIRVKISGITG